MSIGEKNQNETHLYIDYTPFPKKERFHNSKKKFRAIISGVGFGKSAAGVNEMIKEVLAHPKTLNLIFAPTFPMIKNTTMREFWKFCPRELIKEHNTSNHLITFTNEAQIIYLSGDNEKNIDRVRGLTLSSAYADEIALVPRYVFDIIIARLRDPKGSLKFWSTSTPKGMNWMYDLFIEKRGITNPKDYEVFGGTSLDNPYTPLEYKTTLQQTYVGRFAKQEIYGEFVGFEGLVYSSFNRNTHVISIQGKGMNWESIRFQRVIMGIDFGFTNASVCVFAGIDSDGRIFVFDEIHEPGLLINEFIERIKQKIDEHQIPMKYINNFYCDPSEPSFIKMFNQAGLKAIAANNEVLPGIIEVTSYLETQKDGKPRLFIRNNCVQTIKEFEQYRYPDDKEERNKEEVPLKVYDHSMDALRYLIMGLKQKGTILIMA